MNKNADHLPSEISIVWSIDDIKERDEQELLTDNDCREILESIKHNHDATIGVNWDVIDCHIEMFLKEKGDK